ncbi:MAG: hypothetical protein ACRDRG_07775 [Pseudonocardiaceae bacterium]
MVGIATSGGPDEHGHSTNREVIQAHGTALVLSERGISVLRRAPDGAWRFAIALLRLDRPRA